MKTRRLTFYSNNIDYSDLTSVEFREADEKYIDYLLGVEEKFPQQVREIWNRQAFKGRFVDRVIFHYDGRVEVSFQDRSILMLQDANLLHAPRRPIIEEICWVYEPALIWYCEEVTLNEAEDSLFLDARLSEGLLSVQFQDASFYDGNRQFWTTGGPNLDEKE